MSNSEYLRRILEALKNGAIVGLLSALCVGFVANLSSLDYGPRNWLIPIGAALGAITGAIAGWSFSAHRPTSRPRSQTGFNVLIFIVGVLSLLIFLGGFVTGKMNGVSTRGQAGPIQVSWTEDRGSFLFYSSIWFISAVLCLGVSLSSFQWPMKIVSNHPVLDRIVLRKRDQWQSLPQVIKIIILLGILFSPLLYFVIIGLAIAIFG